MDQDRGRGAKRGGVSEPSTADFETFFRRVNPALVRLGYARTGSWAIAEDLAQDAMADAHRRWDVIGGYENPAAWTRRAVLNRSISRHRRQVYEARTLQRIGGWPAADPGDPTLADDELWNAVRSLSGRQRNVVLLLWFEDLPLSEVALVLECGEETVRTHWRRARAHLAKALGAPERATSTRPDTTTPTSDKRTAP